MIYNYMFNIGMGHHEAIFSHVSAKKSRQIKRKLIDLEIKVY